MFEQPCVTCVRRCCHRYTVNISGYDLWVIARALRLAPEQFVRALPVGGERPRGFLLDQRERFYQLALDKRPARTAFKPCVFLIDLPDGTGRCGIYAHRPFVCRSYPALIRGGSVQRREDVLCPDDAWRDGSLEQPGWHAAVLGLLVEHDIYQMVNACWNMRVERIAPERRTLPTYLSYLLHFYAQIEPLRVHLGDSGWLAMCKQWAAALEQGSSPFAAPTPLLADWVPVLAAMVEAAEKLSAAIPASEMVAE
jgi:Fe-S-cluster containining protein